MSLMQIGKVFIKELAAQKTMIRSPIQNLFISHTEQVLTYSREGEPNGSLAPIHFFAVEEASQTFQACKTVLDIGVGTGDVITKMAIVNPRIQFLGIDLSEEMLDVASKKIQDYNLKNVTLLKADMTKLEKLNNKFDGIMSTLALHRLPTTSSLNLAITQCFKVMYNNNLNLFFLDLGRLKLESTIHSILKLHPKMPSYLIEDAYLSQKAAFTIDEFKACVNNVGELKDGTIYFKSIFLVPYLLKVHTQQHKLNLQQKERLKSLFNSLSTQNKMLVQLLRWAL